VFRWQNDKGEELLMLVEDNYGRSIRALNSSDALTFMFQIDNSGPPAAVDVRPFPSLPWARLKRSDPCLRHLWI
jgi:hypothetical protein